MSITPMSQGMPSKVFEGLTELVASHGQNAEEIARRIQLDPKSLHRPDIQVSAHTVNDMLEESAAACNQRFLALELAGLQGWDILGPISPLKQGARTVGEILRQLASLLELHSEALSAMVVEDEAGAAFCYEVRYVGTPLKVGRVQAVELGLAISCYELRRILGRDWRPAYAQFRHAAPTHKAPLIRVFGNKLHFNQDVNALYIAKKDLEYPMGQSARSMVSPAEHIPLALQVDREARQLISSGSCSAQAVADALGMKLRTLQQQLKQQSTNYQAIYDAARLDLARYYLLRSELSVAAISERLGFTETAVFSRFFKAGSGHSPRLFRQLNHPPSSR